MFLDKADCTNPMRYDLATAQDRYNICHRQAIRMGMKRWRAHDYAKHHSKNFPFSDIDKLKQFQEEHFADLHERLGVLSLTADCCNMKMCEEYGDHHKGICVGLDRRILFDEKYIGGGGEVAYSKQLPTILPADSMQTELVKLVLFKKEEYEYEKEYRTFKLWPHHASKEDRIRILPVECFKEVIFGALVDGDTISEICKICSDQGMKVAFYKHRVDTPGNVTKDLLPNIK